MNQKLTTHGFTHAPGLLDPVECDAVGERISLGSAGSGGSRCLLTQPWCASLARRIAGHAALSGLVPSTFVAAQCTYFEKSASRNWLVPIHQDLSIPVAEHVCDAALGGWSEKEGSLFVQAPVSLLEALVAVRLHLDGCASEDGPLRVVPGTHLRGRIAPEAALALRADIAEVACHAGKGDALVLRPLLLHASSKSHGASRRRVLHFLFGPRDLPHGLRWRHAV